MPLNYLLLGFYLFLDDVFYSIMIQIDIQKSVVAISFEGKIAATFIFLCISSLKRKIYVSIYFELV